MQFPRIILGLVAFAIITTDATFNFRIPSSFSSLLPFTFNVTADDTKLGSITLNIKPRFGREVHEDKVKRDVAALDEKTDRENSRLLFPTSTSQWELGLPSGVGLTLGAVGSMAGLIWTVISESLKYKKEHGELIGWKDEKPFKHGSKDHPLPSSGPSHTSYGPPSYSPDYSIPPHVKPVKPEKGFMKGIKEAQAQVMKGISRLVGLRDLNQLLNPGGKKSKKRPAPQYYAYPPAYAPPQEYAQDPAYAPPPMYATAYDPAPAYAPPPPAPPAYAPPPPAPPAYAPPAPAPPAYAPPAPAPPAYAPPAPAPPEYTPPAPIPPPAPYAPPAPPAYTPPAPAPPAYAPPAPIPPPAPYAPPASMYAPHSPRGFNHNPTQNTLSDFLQPAQSNPSSDPVAPPPQSFVIQTNDFLPIIPSPIDPLPFMPSPTIEAQQSSASTDNVPFGIPPSPPRGSRIEDSAPETTPLDPSQQMARTPQDVIPQEAIPIQIDVPQGTLQQEVPQGSLQQEIPQDVTETVDNDEQEDDEESFELATELPSTPIQASISSTELPFGARIKKPVTN